jgi:hypothetical protein
VGLWEKGASLAICASVSQKGSDMLTARISSREPRKALTISAS